MRKKSERKLKYLSMRMRVNLIYIYIYRYVNIFKGRDRIGLDVRIV